MIIIGRRTAITTELLIMATIPASPLLLGSGATHIKISKFNKEVHVMYIPLAVTVGKTVDEDPTEAMLLWQWLSKKPE